MYCFIIKSMEFEITISSGQKTANLHTMKTNKVYLKSIRKWKYWLIYFKWNLYKIKKYPLDK